mmetsp:Transcript_70920/g.203217  ORF Transcript_70920/g.203217 Transcript_70920/m.203217 type:complete len:676 (+) Transcript_70920:145-2172(+)
MIYYDNRSWVGLVFRYKGTVWPKALFPTVIIMVCCLTVWTSQELGDIMPGCAGKTIFGSTMSYLLVFRANTASERYWQGRTYLQQIFAGLRDLVMSLCIDIKGGAAADHWRETHKFDPDLEDIDDIRASLARVNIVRLALAFAVSLRLHTRICYSGYMRAVIDGETKRMVDVDRLRLRGLLTRTEFEEMNDLVPIYNEPHVTKGAALLTEEAIEDILEQPLDAEYEVDTTPDMRQPSAVLMKIRLEIMKHTNEPYGIKDRFAKDVMQFCNALGILFEYITMVITTPIPFPYVHLCKFLLLCFLISMPMSVNDTNGFFTDVILSGGVALSLLGIDALASELADPFGEEMNCLDVNGLITELEDECMKLLELCGDTRAIKAFLSYKVPCEPHPTDPRLEYVCLRSQVAFDGAPGSKCEQGRQWGISAASGTVRKSDWKPGQIQGFQSPPNTPLLPPVEAKKAKDKSEKPQRPSFSADVPSPVPKRSPLLDVGDAANSQSMGDGFMPMEEMGTSETLVFADQEENLNPDCVGLSEGEDEEDAGGSGGAGGGSSSEGSGALKPMGQELRNSASPQADGERRHISRERVASGSAKVRLVEGEASSSMQFRPMEGAGSQSARGFRPMEEMDTQTMNFEEAEATNYDDIEDVIGLSDDEGEDILDFISETQEDEGGEEDEHK